MVLQKNEQYGNDVSEAEKLVKRIPVHISENRNQIKSEAKPRNVKVVKRNNKLLQTLELPIIVNMNPHSIYNKVDEFCTFLKEESVDLLTMSESWEREGLQLDQIILMDDFTIISNVHQRRGTGG